MSTFKNQKMLISINLSDLKPEDIRKSENGKNYLNITCVARKEPDNFGHNVVVYISQTKEEREAKNDKKYIGNAKHLSFDNEDKVELPSLSQKEFDDLPF